MRNSNKTISIIGTGRLGGALALALAKKGFQVENLVARKRQTAENIVDLFPDKPKILTPENFSQISSDIILITTQDFEIAAVAEKLAGNLTHQPFVFHTSGSLSSVILGALKNCKTGSLHPLVSISDAVIGAEKFKNIYFCVEGEPEAVKIAETIVKKLGGKSFSIETRFKPLYHASAVTACGHLVALIDVANEMLSKCGLSTENAQKILLPLIKSTVENLEVQNTAQALTGTFARVDSKTFERHLKSLKKNVSGEALETYLQLGMRSLHLVKEQKSNKDKLKEMRKKILLAKKNLKC